jgi:hypothetical protein
MMNLLWVQNSGASMTPEDEAPDIHETSCFGPNSFEAGEE